MLTFERNEYEHKRCDYSTLFLICNLFRSFFLQIKMTNLHIKKNIEYLFLVYEIRISLKRYKYVVNTKYNGVLAYSKYVECHFRDSLRESALILGICFPSDHTLLLSTHLVFSDLDVNIYS